MFISRNMENICGFSEMNLRRSERVTTSGSSWGKNETKVESAADVVVATAQ